MVTDFVGVGVLVGALIAAYAARRYEPQLKTFQGWLEEVVGSIVANLILGVIVIVRAAIYFVGAAFVVALFLKVVVVIYTALPF